VGYTHGTASKKLQHGKYYQYSHDFERNISGQEYMLTPKKFYESKLIGAEKVLAERLRDWQNLKAKPK
jgi:putative ATPase